MEERWLTYQQVGELFGMSAEAARQRARRLRWRHQRGNDGRTLVLVPEAASLRPRPPGQTAEQTGKINELQAELRAAREARDRADKRVDELLADVRSFTVRTDTLQAELVARVEAFVRADERANRAETERDQLRDQLQAVQQQLKQWQRADTARLTRRLTAALGFFRRKS